MPKWTEDQQKAISQCGHNIIVSAGAGSGKTAVLTERVIEKLKKGIKIDELLILTFTNAAAGEMKDRIRKKISAYPDLKDNLDYLDSSYITTFDSYTLSLVKKYHYLLNVSKNLSIVDNSIISLKKEEILEEVFNFLYEKENEKFLKLINDFCIKNDNNIKSSIMKIITSLELKSDKEEYLNTYIKNYFSDENIYRLIEEYLELINTEVTTIGTYLYLISSCDYTEYYEQLCKSLEPLLNSNGYTLYKMNSDISLPRRPRGTDDIKEFKDKIDESLKKIRELTRFDSIDEIKNTFAISKEYVEAIILVINLYNKKITEFKKENDLYEFTDIEIMAINLLKDNEDVCKEIKDYYKEIMVDEYQDTNDLQEEFISLIANNNVYMVGDIKQSIYGFRNANPLIFKEKYDNYAKGNGGEKIDLLKNFRSRSEVLEGINEIFNLIMDNEIGGAEYKESHQMVFGNTSYEENKKLKQNYNLEILNYQEDEQFTKEEIEAFIIGNDIKDKIASRYEVVDKETGSLRKACYEDFCIIMDRGTSFNIYKKIFEYLGIPLAIYENKKLNNESDLLIINNIITLILKIKDNLFDTEFRYAFLSVARSYLASLEDNEIFKIIKDKSYENTDIYIKCFNIKEKLTSLNIYEVLQMIISEFDLYEKLVTTCDIEDSLIKIDSLLELASNLGNMGYTLEMFNEYLTNVSTSSSDISYSVNTKGINSVKIMNIHKSKGLEFPVCYFSGYYKPFNTSDIKDRFVYDNKYGIITPYFDEGIGTLITKELLKNKYDVDNVSERIRLFYVALTRAREKMIIVSPLDEVGLKALGVVDFVIRKKYTSFLKILNTIKGNLENYIINVNKNEIGLTKKYLKQNKIKNKEIKKVKPIEYEMVDINNEVLEEKHASKIMDQIITEDEKKLLEYGTKMHEIFERANFLNIEDNEYKDVLSNFVKLLNINENTKVYKEHEFIYEMNNITYHGIIDLVLEEENEIKIVDYKLKNIEDEKYDEQLKVYYNYLKIHFDKDIKMYLYSIIDDKLREVKNEN